MTGDNFSLKNMINELEDGKIAERRNESGAGRSLPRDLGGSKETSPRSRGTMKTGRIAIPWDLGGSRKASPRSRGTRKNETHRDPAGFLVDERSGEILLGPAQRRGLALRPTVPVVVQDLQVLADGYHRLHLAVRHRHSVLVVVHLANRLRLRRERQLEWAFCLPASLKMDIKKKFHSFIKKPAHGSGSGRDGRASESLDQAIIGSVVRDQDAEIREYPTDPLEDEAVLQEIQKEYYEPDEKFNASQFELQKLPEKPDMAFVNEQRHRLKRQYHVVSKKVSSLILLNQRKCTTELERVAALQEDLSHSLLFTMSSRKKLREAQETFTIALLRILANHRRRQMVAQLVDSLNTIRTLLRIEDHVQALLLRQDYPGVVQLLIEGQSAAATYGHFKCVSDLNSKLRDNLMLAKEELDKALGSMCLQFQAETYERLQVAYALLGETQTALDQLHLHLTSTILNRATQVMLDHARCSSSPSMQEELIKLHYQDLCKRVAEEEFMSCLIHLCREMWCILQSYQHIRIWHQTRGKDTPSDVEATLSENYIKQKLRRGPARIWGDVQSKVTTFISSADLSGLKLDQFLLILGVVHRLKEIGEELCEGESGIAKNLEESVRNQSVAFIEHQLEKSMEELRIFLENEGWEPFPFKSGGNLFHLEEFRFLNLRDRKVDKRRQGGTSDGGDWRNQSASNRSFLQSDLDPFSPEELSLNQGDNDESLRMCMGGIDERNDEIQDDDEEEIPDELRGDYIDEVTGATVKTAVRQHRRTSEGGSHVPLLTNTTLTVLRVSGKFFQMMLLLGPVAYNAFLCIQQLFDFYFHSILILFPFDTNAYVQVEKSGPIMKLRITANRLKEAKFPCPCVSAYVEDSRKDSQKDLALRLVAGESLVWLASQFRLLKLHFEELLPPSKQSLLQTFYKRSIDGMEELMEGFYMSVGGRAINPDRVLESMAAVNWEIGEIQDTHNAYVEILIRDLQLLSMKLEGCQLDVPQKASQAIWHHAERCAVRLFVDGFSLAKRCSAQGRSWMLLDFRIFIQKLAPFSPIPQIPDCPYVEEYIRAYYKTDVELRRWLVDHQKTYGKDHLLGLIACIPHLSKKSRAQLSAIIEETNQ
ncbi:unnamed protein product [Darwinula stevensoni]|uniref:Coiled-coil domain-containing protein 132 n=1 Tax=Darwinula stevensoni TaxID=69355 RepID=A0A7R8X9H8_9CRUS|nr:unnamed protein product [Darwinula stevensoni]CAG0890662.1 unnamed protein product [Darwinula stevensoni]